MQRLIQVAGLKALHKLVAAKALGNRHGVAAGKARIAIAALGHNLQQALDRKEGQRISADVLADLVDRLVGADKLRLHVGIDAIEARPDDLGRVDADVNLLGASVAQHLDELHHGGAAHDGVIDNNEALAGDVVLERIELHAHAHGTQLLRGLDKRAANVAVLDKALTVGNTALVRKALSGRHTRVGHADDHVGIGRRLARKHAAHVVTARIDRLAVHDGIGTSEVHLLKHAVGAFLSRNALLGNKALGVDAQNLAGADIAHVLSADDVERAGLGSDNPTAGNRCCGRRRGAITCRRILKRGKLCRRFKVCLVKTIIDKLAKHERANTVRVAERVKRALVDERHGVPAAHEFHRFTNALAQMAGTLREVTDKLGGYLGIRIGEERDTQLDKLTAQLVRVDERTVVSERDNHIVDRGKVRLRRLPAFGPRSAVTHVAHSKLTGKGREISVGKDLAEQTQILANHYGAAIAHSDTGGFLAAMLKRTQAEVGEPCDVAFWRPHAKHAALLVQLVLFKISRRAPVGAHVGSPVGRANGFL